MNEDKIIRGVLDKIRYYGENMDFVICPFGNKGKKIKKIMNEEYNIAEKFIVDEKGNSNEGIYKFNEIKIDNQLKTLFIITAYDKEIQNYYLDNIKRIYPMSNSLLVFDDYAHIKQYWEINQMIKKFDFNSNEYRIEKGNKNINFYLPLCKTDFIQKHICLTNSFFEEEQLYWITNIALGGAIGRRIKGGCVLDIGANIGNHTLYFSIISGATVVKAFEPIRLTFNTLKKNICINKLDNIVEPYNVAVGRSRGKGKQSKILIYIIRGQHQLRKL